MVLPTIETLITEVPTDEGGDVLKRFQTAKQHLLKGKITNESVADYLVSKKDLETRRNAILIEEELDSFFGDKEQRDNFKNTYLKPTFSTQEERDESLAMTVFERLGDRDDLTPVQERLLNKAIEIINTDVETVCTKLYTEPQNLTGEEKSRLKSSVQRIQNELISEENREQLENAFSAYIKTLD